MVSSIPCLQAFVAPVLHCPATARFTVALATLGQSVDNQSVDNQPPGKVSTATHDRLVLVDERQYPIGWVSAQQLLHYLVTSGLLAQWSMAPDKRSHAAADLPLIDLMPSLVEPLIVVAADLAIDAFLLQLQTAPDACYALVSAADGFLGLLDRPQLLQFVTTHASLFAVSNAKTDSPASATDAQPHAYPLNPLLHELLEHLPLPVMLQTHDGQVLVQNSIWRTQISELLDPGWLRQEVATLLEMPSDDTAAGMTSPDRVWSSLEPPITSTAETWARRSSTAPAALETRTGAPPAETHSGTHTSGNDHSLYDSLYDESEVNGSGEWAAASLSASSCQLGPKPGTCICVCPLKDGQEQVLQFVRIPLGTLSALTDLQLHDQAKTLATAVETQFNQPDSPSQLFRLAALLSTMRDTADVSPAYAEPQVDLVPVPNGLASTSEELWLVLAQDVTEQQQLARELTAKNADLIQLNRLKDEFLACISHELRTPLTAVLGLSSLLKDQTLGALNQRQAHYAQLIYQSGRHLMAVVNDILDLTRMETGQLELVLEPVDLTTVCQRAFAQAQQLRLQEHSPTEPEAEQPTFSLTLEPGLGLLVADEQRLRQMLVHLLSNALKFTEANDPIGLRVGRWGGWIALTVWDTGIGIPAEKQHLIFQKFQQLENPLTRRFEGTGLGLVLTQRLARLHGGDVTFISKEGEGSQFTILLPPSPPRTPEIPDAFADASQRFEALGHDVSRRSHTAHGLVSAAGSPPLLPSGDYALDISASQRCQLVLIVEAVPQCIERLSDQLTGLGYRVVIARSGTEALEKARRLQPCAIFLNPVLPLLSGWDVLTLLKSNAETQQIPVVMTATKVDEEQARQRQADHLLSLPIQPKVLQRCLQQLVSDRQATLHPRPPVSLTILRLSPDTWSKPHQPLPTANLDALLHSCQCRILEADDLEQAELLARVWKPNVVLLDGILADGAAYFRQYSQHIFLASLPLVTIDQITSQAANQSPGLLVFPCLSTAGSQGSPAPGIETSALLQVIQIAAGYAWRPLVLALDATTLPLALETQTPQVVPDRGLDSFPKEMEWLQALTQYLHTAGLRGAIGRCWQEVLQQLESHSVDVLLLCWTDAIAQSFTAPMLSAIQQLPKRPPILVLDHRSHQPTEPTIAIANLPDALQQIATKVLPAPLSMTELLSQIQQALKINKR